MNTNENATFVQSVDEQQNPPTETTSTESGVAVASETEVYYYAVLDDSDIVTSVMESPFPAPDSYTNYILIDSLDESLVGKLYDRDSGAFVDPPVIYCDTDNVSYQNTATTLSEKLNQMDAATVANTTAIAENTAARHTHANQTVLDGITAEKVATWDAGTGSGSTVDAYTKTESDAKYALVGSSYTKEESDAKYALAGTTGATMTGTEILEALDTVDGTGSGLDADTLDGMEASAFAQANHTHDYAATNHTHTDYAAATHEHTGYASSDHTHNGYAASNHTHTLADLGAAAANHTHDGYASTEHTHTGYAASTHTHDGYAATSHTHTASEVGAATASHTHTASEVGAASSSHTHTPASIGAATSSHTHSGYASSSHTHSGYLPTSGGTVSGDLEVDGELDVWEDANFRSCVRMLGTQALYNSGTMMVLASNNLPTQICGSAITSAKTITVSSDKRLKKNIEELDRERISAFIKKVKPVAYNYVTEADGTKKHIGVLAQQLLRIDEEIAAFFVNKNEDGYYSVDYAALALMAALV